MGTSTISLVSVVGGIILFIIVSWLATLFEPEPRTTTLVALTSMFDSRNQEVPSFTE